MFQIGHPAYPSNGANAYKLVKNQHLAVMELIKRGATPTVARYATIDALHGRHIIVECRNYQLCEIVWRP